MESHCDVCDRTNKTKSKREQFESLRHNEFAMCIRTKHLIQNPDVFDIDEKIDEYITNDIEKFDLYLVGYDFKLILDKEFTLYIKSELQNNPTIFYSKKFLFLWIEYFSESGYIFSHNDEMCGTTISSKRYMSYDFYTKRLMQKVELKFNKTIDEKHKMH